MKHNTQWLAFLVVALLCFLARFQTYIFAVSLATVFKEFGVTMILVSWMAVFGTFDNYASRRCTQHKKSYA